jgi:DNA-binding IclR family transcriptional regulator
VTAVLDRVLRLLELLASHAEGLPLHELADRLDIPRSAAHRLLADLAKQGYVRQDHEGAPYALTTKLVSLGLTYLAQTGVLDIAQPIMDRLAASTGELVRLGVVDGDRLTWVAKAQGARSGLRYDPDAGADAHLASTANGHAWLSSMSEEKALALVTRQGFGDARRLGPRAPMTVQALLEQLRVAREHGYAVVTESSAPGMAAMAAVVRRPGSGEVIGVLSIAGPVLRLDEARMHALAPTLLEAAQEMSAASLGSRSFAGRRRPEAAA